MRPSTRWTCSRQASIAWRAEISRWASLAANSEMVSRLSMNERVVRLRRSGALAGGRRTDKAGEEPGHNLAGKSRASLDDFWHEEEAVGLGRRVAQRLGVGQGRVNFVRARDVDEWHGMSGRLDLADVQALELFDVPEHLAELRPELMLFFRCETQPGQVGDVLHVKVCGSHAARI